MDYHIGVKILEHFKPLMWHSHPTNLQYLKNRPKKNPILTKSMRFNATIKGYVPISKGCHPFTDNIIISNFHKM